MRHIMFCISGWSGTGKDEFARQLVKGGAVQTGLADPAKRHMADVYGFTEEQLFGPSQMRNAGDPRYPKNFVRSLNAKVVEDEYVFDLSDTMSRIAAMDAAHRLGLYDMYEAGLSAMRNGDSPEFRAKVTDPRFSLSPREALQVYCEQLNNFYIDTWIAKGVADQVLLARGGASYSRMGGVRPAEVASHWNPRTTFRTCFADFRHIHECVYVRRASSESLVPVLVRVKRPTVTKPPYDHRSETEQLRIRDAAFDFVVDNDGTLEDLYGKVDDIVNAVLSRSWVPKAWDESFVLPASSVGEGYTP